MPRTHRSKMKAGPDYHPIHDSVFGPDDEIVPLNEDALPGADAELVLRDEEDEPRPMVDDTPPYTDRASVNLGGTAVQPEGFQPMRNLGDTDQGDRQPDGSRRR